MATTFYRVRHGSGDASKADSTTRIQEILKDTAPGEYPVDVVIAGTSGDEDQLGTGAGPSRTRPD